MLAGEMVSPTGFSILFLSSVLYVCGLYIYRMFFDSLSHIPGPKLAAATLWYEFYYDVVKQGQYTWEIGRMHEKYGPIIRISPYEIHINDPEFIDEIYPGSGKRSCKYVWAMKMFGLRYAFLVTESHELHRVRRGAFAHYLSKASLMRLEPGIQAVVAKLVSRLQGIKGTGKVINLLDVYASLTGDVIGQYAFAKPYGFLDDEEFSPFWHETMMNVSQNGHLLKQFGWLQPMMEAMPEWLVRIVQPRAIFLLNWRKVCSQDGCHVWS